MSLKVVFVSYVYIICLFNCQPRTQILNNVFYYKNKRFPTLLTKVTYLENTSADFASKIVPNE